MKILVSACLLGENCKYDGKNNYREAVARLSEHHELIPVCPEVLGGLPTPRVPAEICRDCEGNVRVINSAGADVTEEYLCGAKKALRIAQENCCEFAVLKERSPSCGCGEIYDGTFSHRVVPGDGITAGILKEYGIKIIGESEILE